MNWLWKLCTRRITGTKCYVQRCAGFDRYKVQGNRVEVNRVYYYADTTKEKTRAGLLKVVNQAKRHGFHPKHFMAITPCTESIRIPFWTKAFWTGNTKDVTSKMRVRVERKRG